MSLLRQVIENVKIRRQQRVISSAINGGFSFGDIMSETLPFSKLVFLNISEILTDLTNDVTFENKSTLSNNTELFIQFDVFFKSFGKYVFGKLYQDGYVVIGYGELGFKVLTQSEYTTRTGANNTILVEPINRNFQVYVMRSETYRLAGSSDVALLQPFLKLLDNVMGGANTIAARLGALIVASPKQSNNPTPDIMGEVQKKTIETDMTNNYGLVGNQKLFYLFSRPMELQTISLASLDNKMQEKLKVCVLAIADRIKVPANQIALIDAMTSKSFANGSEMIAGDFAKYQSFERLLNNTFVAMANDIGLRVDYTIYNKPQQQVQQTTVL